MHVEAVCTLTICSTGFQDRLELTQPICFYETALMVGLQENLGMSKSLGLVKSPQKKSFL